MGEGLRVGADGTASSRPRRFYVDPVIVDEYVATTLDDRQAYARSATAPPVFAVVAQYPATHELLTTVLSRGALEASIHLRQDMRFRRPLRVGERVCTVSELHGVRGSRRGTTLCYRVTTRDDRDEEVVQLFATLLLRTVVDRSSMGDEAPDATPPGSRSLRPVGERTIDLPDDITYRFGRVSGDTLPVHTSDEVARRAGFPGVILHGMCTLSICAGTVGTLACDGDTSRIRRLAVTFTKPLYPRQSLTVTVGEDVESTDPRRFGFVAQQGRRLATRGGFAEVSLGPTGPG